jgi:hypothetical protein
MEEVNTISTKYLFGEQGFRNGGCIILIGHGDVPYQQYKHNRILTEKHKYFEGLGQSSKTLHEHDERRFSSKLLRFTPITGFAPSKDLGQVSGKSEKSTGLHIRLLGYLYNLCELHISFLVPGQATSTEVAINYDYLI